MWCFGKLKCPTITQESTAATQEVSQKNILGPFQPQKTVIGINLQKSSCCVFIYYISDEE